MATETRKVLGQLNPGATTLTAIYTVPAATQAVVSSITVCNQGVDGTFRVSVAVAGAANNAKQYLYYDLAILANDTFAASLGMALGALDEVRGYASHANMSFNVFGVQIA